MNYLTVGLILGFVESTTYYMCRTKLSGSDHNLKHVLMYIAMCTLFGGFVFSVANVILIWL